MNKLNILAIPLLGYILCSTSATAQDRGWQVGLSGGPSHMALTNTSRGDGSPAIQQTHEKFYQPNGYHLGLMVEKSLNEHWSLQSGLGYEKNTKSSSCYIPPGGFGNENGTDYVQWGNVKEQLQYLSLPLQMVYQYPISAQYSFSLYAKAGLKLRYLLDYYADSRENSVTSPIGVVHHAAIKNYWLTLEQFGDNELSRSKTGKIYTPWLLSTPIELGLQMAYGRSILRLGIQYDHVWSKPENKKKLYWYGHTYGEIARQLQLYNANINFDEINTSIVKDYNFSKLNYSSFSFSWSYLLFE